MFVAVEIEDDIAVDNGHDPDAPFPHHLPATFDAFYPYNNSATWIDRQNAANKVLEHFSAADVARARGMAEQREAQRREAALRWETAEILRSEAEARRLNEAAEGHEEAGEGEE
jgi:hypothetical protein